MAVHTNTNKVLNTLSEFFSLHNMNIFIYFDLFPVKRLFVNQSRAAGHRRLSLQQPHQRPSSHNTGLNQVTWFNSRVDAWFQLIREHSQARGPDLHLWTCLTEFDLSSLLWLMFKTQRDLNMLLVSEAIIMCCFYDLMMTFLYSSVCSVLFLSVLGAISLHLMESCPCWHVELLCVVMTYVVSNQPAPPVQSAVPDLQTAGSSSSTSFTLS